LVFYQTHLENCSSELLVYLARSVFFLCALWNCDWQKEKRRWRCPSGYISYGIYQIYLTRLYVSNQRTSVLIFN